MLKRFLTAALLLSLTGCVVHVTQSEPRPVPVVVAPEAAPAPVKRPESHRRARTGELERYMVVTTDRRHLKRLDEDYLRGMTRDRRFRGLRLVNSKALGRGRYLIRVEGLLSDSQFNDFMYHLARRGELLAVVRGKAAHDNGRSRHERDRERDRDDGHDRDRDRDRDDDRHNGGGVVGGAVGGGAGAAGGLFPRLAEAAKPEPAPVTPPAPRRYVTPPPQPRPPVAKPPAAARKPVGMVAHSLILGVEQRFSRIKPGKLVAALGKKCLRRGETLRFQRTLANGGHLVTARVQGGEKREEALLACLKKQPQLRYAEQNERRRVR